MHRERGREREREKEGYGGCKCRGGGGGGGGCHDLIYSSKFCQTYKLSEKTSRSIWHLWWAGLSPIDCQIMLVSANPKY